MTRRCAVRLRVQVSPWVRWYIAAVALMAHLTGREPDMDKVAYWAMKGVKLVQVREAGLEA